MFSNNFNFIFDPQQASKTQSIYPNNPIYENMFVEYKLSKNSEGINIQNPFEIKNNFLKIAYIITRNDFEKLSQSNNINVSLGLNYPLKFFTNIKDVLTSFQNNTELYFINQKFLEAKRIHKDNKNLVHLYKDENKILIFFPNENNNNRTLEIKIKADFGVQNNLININENQKEKTFKKLILLNAFEKDFIGLMKMPISDEYDLKEFYLINKNIIEKFKEDHRWFNQISNINYDFSFKGHIKNMNKIIQKNQNIFNDPSLYNYQINYNIYKEENNFVSNINKLWNKVQCPFEFILVPEYLFDLFYSDFTNHTIKKENFKYNVLIGNDVLFIQSKEFNNIFYVYKISPQNESLEIVCAINYNKESIFYREVKNYIKGYGLENYFKARKFDLNNINIYNKLIENNQAFLEYIILKKYNREKQNIAEIKNTLNKNLNLLITHNNFIERINKIQGTTIEINNINDLFNNLYNFNSMKCIIIYGPDLKAITYKLHFDKIKGLLKLKNSPNYNQEENKIINIIMNNPIKTSLKELLNHANIFNGMNYNENFKAQSIFNFVNLDLISQIDNSPEIINKFKKGEALLFNNKNLYYLYYQNSKKFFKINQVSGMEFSIEEVNFEQGFEKLYQSLYKLVKYEEIEKKQMKNLLKNITKPIEYYCVNQKWMNDFKKFLNYNIIQTYPNDIQKWNEFMGRNIKLPNELNNNIIGLFPKIDNFQNINVGIPKNFELIKKDLFDKIIYEFNSKYNTKINFNKIYLICFGGERIFILDENNPNIYLIYTKINSAYELDYIIQLHNDYNLSNLFGNLGSDENIDKIFSLYYNINLAEKSAQKLVLQNNVIGDLYVIREKKLDEPNHCLGLQNIGATCYMNATLQCLCHVVNLKNYFLNKQQLLKDIENKDCPLTMEFSNVINNLWKKTYEGKSYYAPYGFKEIISKMNPLFQGVNANDSKDLILFLYENIHREINNPSFYNYKGQDDINNKDLQEFRNEYYPKNSSILIDTFYFEHQNEIICLNCSVSKKNYNIYNMLVFPLEKVREYMIQKNHNCLKSVKLEDCFEHYKRDEKLFGSNQIYCNSCRQMADASNINMIYNSPEVLTIILNRGKGLQFEVNFEYPLRLNIDKFILDKTCKNNNYDLICVLTHLGPSGMSGHFVAFCKSPVDGKWYLYNDAQVSSCKDPRNQDNTMIEGIPYVLFYQKCYVKENMITLYVRYYDKEVYVDVEKDIIISELINRIHIQYEIPLNIMLYLQLDDNLIPLLPNNMISQYPNIKDRSIIVAQNYSY